MVSKSELKELYPSEFIHLTPCGRYLGGKQLEAYKETMETDLYISIYGDYRDEP